MIVEPFKPVLLNGLYEEVYGCLPPSVRLDKDGKQIIKRYGVHAAIKRLCKWAQSGHKTYVCETDIHHAYASVNIDVLAKQMEKVIRDKEWLRITYQFLHYNHNKDACGLILGHYTTHGFSIFT